MRLRRLEAADMADLNALSRSAGWNQTDDDWLRMMRLEPEGCLGVEVDGRIVASATSIIYEGKLSWIGMVLTLPEFRGQGHARRLMKASLEYCGGTVVRLDASDMGKPLYEDLGFVSECFVERWRRDPAPCDGPAAEPGTLVVDEALDRAVFGADRSALMQDLAALGGESLDGAYALERPGEVARYFGPCVSGSAEAFASLLRSFVSRHDTEPLFVDLFPHHNEAAAVARELAFRPVRRLTRMVLRPAGVEMPDPRVYAIAGFEYG